MAFQTGEPGGKGICRRVAGFLKQAESQRLGMGYDSMNARCSRIVLTLAHAHPCRDQVRCPLESFSDSLHFRLLWMT